MDNALINRVVQTMNSYAGEAPNGQSYLLQDSGARPFSILDVGTFNGQRVTGVRLSVLLQSDLIINEHDQNDYPLVNALTDAGVSRIQIILAYAGEAVPEIAED
jgi:hypothetical protein